MRLVTASLLVAAALVLAAPVAGAAGPLRTAVLDTVTFANPAQQQRAFAAARATGATIVRLPLFWHVVAPASRPPGFDPANPASARYNWGWFDDQVRLAVANGLEPLVVVAYAPKWAEGAGPGEKGTVAPDAAAFGVFARTAARRYSGGFSPSPGAAPLPRVRLWQAWNEPNRDYFLMPQYQNGRITSALRYRDLLRTFAAGVRAVHGSNVVVAGGLSPLGRRGKPAPLAFMRQMFCLDRKLRRTCNLRGAAPFFDVWAHNAYTTGGPTHRAAGRDDVSLGDLPKLRRFLQAAVRARHARTPGGVKIWVTEISWDAQPADPRGLPPGLHARWVSHALYEMWRHGVTVATWWRIVDDPLHGSPYQSGFFDVHWQPKPSLKAFRFPVVAFRRPGAAYVWGRTPAGRRGSVAIELKTGSAWRRVAVVRTNRHGIFQRRFPTGSRNGAVRARYGGEASVPFSLKPVRNRVVNPFGCGGSIPC